jgi:hypothetical protein
LNDQRFLELTEAHFTALTRHHAYSNWGKVRGRGVHSTALESDFMSILPKATLTVAVFVATCFFLNLLSYSLIPLGEARWIAVSVSIFAALGTAWYAWKRTGVSLAGTLVANIAYGAIVAGALGFLSGFVGPMIFTPEANMGPMLGIIAGPLGFVSGGSWGLVYWLSQRPRVTTAESFPVRHTLQIVTVGLALLSVCLLGDRLLETLSFRPVYGAKLFIPLWLTGAAISMWTSISKAHYAVTEAAMMFLAVFGIPAAVAILIA